jgi:hypothetical protein
LKFHTLRDTVALMGLVTIRATLQQSVHWVNITEHGMDLKCCQPTGSQVGTLLSAAIVHMKHHCQSGIGYILMFSAGPHLRALSNEVGSAKMRLLVLYLNSGTAYKAMGGQRL